MMEDQVEALSTIEVSASDLMCLVSIVFQLSRKLVVKAVKGKAHLGKLPLFLL
jgi:hypothetical protein